MTSLTDINFREYRDDDLDLIIEFMQDCYAMNGPGFAWQIDRINFTRSVARMMNDVSLEEWAESILIVEEGDNIVAVVNNEGENGGEAFFHLIRDTYDDAVINKMFDFVEEKLLVTKDDESFVALRIKHDHKLFIDEAIKRGFKKDWHEPIAVLDITLEMDKDSNRFSYGLPAGFSIKVGADVTPKEKADAHSKAFGYYKDLPFVKRATLGFELMTIQPSYNPELDITVCNEDGLAVAFATVWLDEINKVATLEPVGTHEDYRHMGLAKAAIYEGIKRIEELGATKLYVGSDQKFYKKIGFEVIDKLDVYRKDF